MFEIRCGQKEDITFGCGHARNEAQITFYQCSLVKDHDGRCYDRGQEHILFSLWDDPESTYDYIYGGFRQVIAVYEIKPSLERRQ